MKDTNKIPKHKSTTYEYLETLHSYLSYVKLIDATNKSFKKVHSWLMDREKTKLHQYASVPTIKTLSVELQISIPQLRKHLEMIYQEIHKLNYCKPNLFTTSDKTICQLYFEHNGEETAFKVGLKFIPRLGENIEFTFVYPIIGCTFFYVESVRYNIDESSVDYEINLTSKRPNPYLELLKEKAFLKGQITSTEFWSIDQVTISNEKLLKLNSNL